MAAVFVVVAIMVVDLARLTNSTVEVPLWFWGLSVIRAVGMFDVFGRKGALRLYPLTLML